MTADDPIKTATHAGIRAAQHLKARHSGEEAGLTLTEHRIIKHAIHTALAALAAYSYHEDRKPDQEQATKAEPYTVIVPGGAIVPGWGPGSRWRCEDCLQGRPCGTATCEPPAPAFADGPALAELPRCPAHGSERCAPCARNPEPCLAGNEGCDYYRETGMHWDTCPHRIIGFPAAPYPIGDAIEVGLAVAREEVMTPGRAIGDLVSAAIGVAVRAAAPILVSAGHDEGREQAARDIEEARAEIPHFDFEGRHAFRAAARIARGGAA